VTMVFMNFSRRFRCRGNKAGLHLFTADKILSSRTQLYRVRDLLF
jgi:hypothetical protein